MWFPWNKFFTPDQFGSFQINLIFARSVVIRIDHFRILWQMTVFHFRELSVSWCSQTVSDRPAAVGTISALTENYIYICVNPELYIFIPIAFRHINERMLTWAVDVYPFFETVWQVFTLQCGCMCAFVASMNMLDPDSVLLHSCVYVRWQRLRLRSSVWVSSAVHGFHPYMNHQYSQIGIKSHIAHWALRALEF